MELVSALLIIWTLLFYHITMDQVGSELGWLVTMDQVGSELGWLVTMDQVGSELGWLVAMDQVGSELVGWLPWIKWVQSWVG